MYVGMNVFLCKHSCAKERGPVSTCDNRVSNGPLGRSLHLFARTAHSTHSLRCALLASITHSILGLAHSLWSPPHGTVEINEYVFMLQTRLTGINAFLVVTRNTPSDAHYVHSIAPLTLLTGSAALNYTALALPAHSLTLLTSLIPPWDG